VHRLHELALAEQLLLLAELPRLSVEIDEDGDLRPKHVRVERLREEIDRAGRVAAEDLPLVRRDRGQEDDRDQAGLLALLDERGRLEAV
jgi:hypothetical protein